MAIKAPKSKVQAEGKAHNVDILVTDRAIAEAETALCAFLAETRHKRRFAFSLNLTFWCLNCHLTFLQNVLDVFVSAPPTRGFSRPFRRERVRKN